MNLREFPDFEERSGKTFKAFYHVTGWYPINFGINVDFQKPNMEIHIPFGFIRIGWDNMPRRFKDDDFEDNKFMYKTFGFY
jgi:hypothetical protein